MTDTERQVLHAEVRDLQQYLVTRTCRQQHGKAECDLMAAVLDMFSSSCTQDEADAHLVEVRDSVLRILK